MLRYVWMLQSICSMQRSLGGTATIYKNLTETSPILLEDSTWNVGALSFEMLTYSCVFLLKEVPSSKDIQISNYTRAMIYNIVLNKHSCLNRHTPSSSWQLTPTFWWTQTSNPSQNGCKTAEKWLKNHRRFSSGLPGPSLVSVNAQWVFVQHYTVISFTRALI